MTLARRASHAGIAATMLGAGVMAAGALASGPPAASQASGVPACVRQQLRVSMTHIPGSEGAGQTGYQLTISNPSRTTCQIGNHPGLKLLGAHGKRLPTRVSYQGKSAPVTIATGKHKSLHLRFSPDVAGPGEPQTKPCEPTAHSVEVLLTAPAQGSVAGPISPPTPVCEHGSMSATSL